MYHPYGVVRGTAQFVTRRIPTSRNTRHSTTLTSTHTTANPRYKTHGNIDVATYDGESLETYPYTRLQSMHLFPLSAAQTCYRTQKGDDSNLDYSRSIGALDNINHVLLGHSSASKNWPLDESLDGSLAKRGDSLKGRDAPRARVFPRYRYLIPYKATIRVSVSKPASPFALKGWTTARPFSTGTPVSRFELICLI